MACKKIVSADDFYGEVPSIPGGHVTDGQTSHPHLLDTVGKGVHSEEGIVGIYCHHFLRGTLDTSQMTQVTDLFFQVRMIFV